MLVGRYCNQLSGDLFNNRNWLFSITSINLLVSLAHKLVKASGRFVCLSGLKWEAKLNHIGGSVYGNTHPERNVR